MRKTAAAVLLVLLLSSMTLYAQSTGDYYINNPVVKTGYGVGAMMAIVTSWTRNRSVLWALLHSVLGWVYVGYFVITRKPEEQRF